MALAQAHIDLLIEGARRLGVILADDATTRLSLYLEELLLWSARVNLVSQRDPIQILRKHVLDSLAVIPFLPKATTILDLGSGAGLPGVPLASVLQETAISLLEVRKKRVSFLKAVKRKLNLPNLQILEGRAEELARQEGLRNAFDIVISRATWSLNVFLQYAPPFLHTTGIAIAMKGPYTTAEAWPDGFTENELFHLKQHSTYTLPFGAERRQLFLFSHQCST
ncbi:MAG TPA: 16S rRNA (guanine(527)-N(7))-methyltransferase RsmG [Methylomirabilota bacterium]|jgi:16S rRNA (guanine527-N7)-methyltransferase|nr:16S rRNA (guanine(527)-N(7))-methyltransferase RsmG [Methylomirabilota bacterium]